MNKSYICISISNIRAFTFINALIRRPKCLKLGKVVFNHDWAITINAKFDSVDAVNETEKALIIQIRKYKICQFTIWLTIFLDLLSI